MKRVVYFVSVALALGFAVASASEKPVMKIAPGVLLMPLAETDVAFTVPPEMADYAHSYFVLVNDSDRHIDAVTVVWRYRSKVSGEMQNGIQKTYEQWGLDKSQFYHAAAAHSRMMLDPGAAGPHAFGDASDKQISLIVDSIVFSDGEIVGPDKMDIGADMTARYAAAQAVSQEFHAGKRDGIAPVVTANNIHKMLHTGNTLQDKWRGSFASRIAASVTQRPELTALHLRELDNMAKPPKFFKKEGN